MKTSLLQLNAGSKRKEEAEARRSELMEELATVEERLDMEYHPTCEHYKSCGKYVRWQKCQCNSVCAKYNSCCQDYSSFCSDSAGSTPSPTQSLRIRPSIVKRAS